MMMVIIVAIICGAILLSVCVCGLVVVKLKTNTARTYVQASPELPITTQQAVVYTGGYESNMQEDPKPQPILGDRVDSRYDGAIKMT